MGGRGGERWHGGLPGLRVSWGALPRSEVLGVE